MRINLIEYKKCGDLETLFNNMLIYCLDNWDSKFKNSLEWETMKHYKFIKKDYVDLKEIESMDEMLLEISLKILLNSLIKKDNYNNINIKELVNATETEILNMEVVDDSMEKSIYYKSLKEYKLITNKNEIDINILNENSTIKKYFVNISLNIINDMGVEWNPIITNALIKLQIINS